MKKLTKEQCLNICAKDFGFSTFEEARINISDFLFQIFNSGMDLYQRQKAKKSNKK